MKKILGTLLSAGAALFLLTSCGSSPQDEFVSYMEKQSKQTEGTFDFKMGISELEMPETTDKAANPMVGMLATQLKDISVTGTIKSATKPETAFDMDMKVNALGMELPINMIGSFGKEPKMYMATDIMESIAGIVDSMAGTSLATETDYSKLKGKYVDVIALDETLDQGSFDEMTKEMEAAQKNSEELQKKVTDYIKGLDKKSFTKKDGVLSHTFTKSEFEEITKIVAKESDTSVADLEEGFKAFEDFSMTINLDPKKDKTDMTFKMAPSADQTDAAGFKSITLAFEMTLKDKKANITLPKEADILTEEEMNTLFPEASGATLGAQTITDEDFQEMKAAFVEQKDSLDEDTKTELLTMYKDALSEEQYKELEAALK